MNRIEKNPGIVPGFSDLYLVPVENIIFFFDPHLHIHDKDANFGFDWAMDTLRVEGDPVGVDASKHYNISISGFVAGVSDEATRKLIHLASGRYVAIATNYNGDMVMAGTRYNPLSLSFEQQHAPSVGYTISLAGKTLIPPKPVKVFVGEEPYPGEDPPVPNPKPIVYEVLTSTIPESEQEIVQGGGVYYEDTTAHLFVASLEHFQGLGWYSFVHWRKMTGVSTYDVVSTDNEYSFTVTGPVHMVAYFEYFGVLY